VKTTIAYAVISMLLSFITILTVAQTPVVTFQSNYVPATTTISSYSAFPNNPGTFLSCITTPYTYNWNTGTNNELKLISFTANSKTYVIAGVPSVQVKLRRVNNANATGNRSILYSESTIASAVPCPGTNILNFKAPYKDDMAAFLNNNILNQGTDNLFTNAGNGDGNNNNIERVDVVFSTGVATANPADAGFILCERGNNNAHDGFRIAAILSIDASKDPTSFGAVKTCVAGNGTNNGSWGHPSISGGNKQLAAYVLRKDAADPYLKVSSNVNQEIGGVFFSLASLGVAANQVVYGYALIGPDGTANPTSAQLLNVNDAAVYPTNTAETSGGGLDLISVNTFFGTDQALALRQINLFKAALQNNDAVLNWELKDLQNESIVSLEKSDDGINFFPIYTYNYNETDGTKIFHDKLIPGSYYYRLKIKSTTGGEIYSHIVTVQLKYLQEWKVYPTLIKAADIINIEGLADGNYDASLQEINGQQFKFKCLVRSGKGSIDLKGGSIASGIYLLSLEKDGKTAGKANKIIIRNF